MRSLDDMPFLTLSSLCFFEGIRHSCIHRHPYPLPGAPVNGDYKRTIVGVMAVSEGIEKTICPAIVDLPGFSLDRIDRRTENKKLWVKTPQ